MHSDGDDDHLVDVAYAGAGYDRFNVAFDGHAFHHVDADGRTDTAPLALDIQPDGADGRTVRYAYGSSEGRAFHFQHFDGCWQLTRELPPPLD